MTYHPISFSTDPVDIARLLAEYGLTLPCDARWISAVHRCEFGDEAPVVIRTVMAACRLCAGRPRDDNEILARSYGL